MFSSTSSRFSWILAVVTILLIFTASAATAASPVSLTVKKVIEQPAGGDPGTARVLFEITSGPLQGKTFEYTHQLWGNDHYDPAFSEGTVFVGEILVDKGEIQRLELGQQRKDYTIVLLFVVLTLTLIGLAGWEGFIGFFCSLLTLGLILYGFFPVALNATGVLWSGVLLCFTTILFTVPLVLRGSRPSVPAILSLLFVTGVLFLFSEWGLDFLKLFPSRARHSRLVLTHLNQFVPNGSAALKPVLTTGIVLGTLGAMMDVAVVISSTVNEITRDSPSIGFRDAMRSGMTVGREILSTMINTLIFAYMGILLPVLLAFHVFEFSWIRFVNYSFVGIELLRIGAGLLGLSLIIPATALVSAWWSR